MNVTHTGIGTADRPDTVVPGRRPAARTPRPRAVRPAPAARPAPAERHERPGGPGDPFPLVNATGGAELLRIGAARFARLARVGCFDPVDIRLNRHWVIVWRYPAEELLTFAEQYPALLKGPAPAELRDLLRHGADLRPPRWRRRRTALLAGQAEDPWQKAAALAVVLEPPALDAAVPDAEERSLLCRLRPPLIDGRLSPEQQDVVAPLLTAADPAEAREYRAALLDALAAARAVQPAASAAVRAVRRP
ncbi:DUF6397 family protein [Streptomyces johnsoniae]|uniref:DUF6397 family protein n=1 Tax=Streptomyces johnsoniae TaxID=3075532 RepID=A0ABU2S885_9ACTN|nr:DUF6397 family protein [Streptomyces sp. DSM 41886]MDT0444619.1 DUF6397 family protein [Streptomyces sp. DSM 41886]